MKSMKLCLTEESYKELKNCYADIVISCGSEIAAVNLLFTRENNAKNVILMKPSLISSRNFDLAIIPEHDRPPQNRNIVKTLGTPNLITPKRMADDLRLLERMVNLDGKKSIGLFIGGESKNYTFNSFLIKEVLESVIRAAKELDANILATTSRRTNRDISDFVRMELGKTEFAKLIIVANERNPEWVVGSILAASDVVIVSGESSSMISEAASSGKHVIVFKPIRKLRIFKNNKHELFLNNLASSGIVRISEIKKLKEDVVELINLNEKPKKLDDNIRILEAVRRII